MSAPQPLPVFDGCQTVRRIRTGPVADLYHAIQQPLGRPVLVKALSSSILPSSPFAATLEREARLLADLQHPAIPRLYDFVRHDDRMWLVLEYVDGYPLDELIEKLGRVPPAAATAIALEIARGLDHAHQRDVVHRDLNPRNVMVSKSGQVKLTNFAVAVDEHLPTAPELLDTAGITGPAYMAPEQILGEPADPRSDVFSLGVVLYEMLSGKRPFDAPDERSVTQRIRHDPPAPLGRLVSAIPGALERIVLRCLEKMSSDRFHSAAELVIALESVLTELDPASPRMVVARALASAGLADGVVKIGDEPPPSLAAVTRRPSLAPATQGLAVCFALVVAGGAVIQYFAAQTEGVTTARGTGEDLRLVPSRAGYLRVVADPWADVYVDGQKVETTPFARAIPLRPGTHHLRLEHPNAPAERRIVQLVAGESILVDVKMQVVAPRGDAGDAASDDDLDGGDGGDARPSP